MSISIAFVVNNQKTKTFYEVSKRLEKDGFSIFWISPNTEWKTWLIERDVPESNILDVATSWVVSRRKLANNFPSLLFLEKHSENRIGNIILSDRNLKTKKTLYSKSYLEHASKVVEYFLSKNNINIVFAEITWAFELIIEMVARKLGIKCLMPHTVRIPDDRFAFFEGFLNNKIFKIEANSKDYKSDAEDFLKKFREQKPRPRYFSLNNKLPKNPLNSISKVIKHIKWSADETKFTLWDLIKNKFFTYLNSKVINNLNLFVSNPDLDAKYLLVTLHKQPESTIDLWGGMYSNQYDNIEKLSRVCGVNTWIYVKEHSNAIGDRSLSWYKKLKKLPNVILIDPYLDSYRLVQNSYVVISVSGTVCYEAALMGKKAYTFADMFFGEVLTGNNINCSDLFSIVNNIDATPCSFKSDEKLSDFLSKIFANSFTGIMSDPQSDPYVLEESNIDNLYYGFKTVCKKIINMN